jgi:hypothetical protein
LGDEAPDRAFDEIQPAQDVDSRDREGRGDEQQA